MSVLCSGTLVPGLEVPTVGVVGLQVSIGGFERYLQQNERD